MKINTREIIMHNQIFFWILLATLILLTIPLLAMQFTTEVNWTFLDFGVMGGLIFLMSSIFVLVARIIQCKYWALTAILFLIIFLWIWAELAVGIFTSIGS